jgi:glycosyltransferase involved in cell wall biosynthesis
MRFSIVTPSFRHLSWLKRCVRSTADQGGVEVEHIIQDGGSGSELETWVREHSKARLFVEKDNGMYDALNRALDRTTGEIVGQLNSDEQYLPGTLERVARFFADRPEVDILAGDYLIVDPQQQLLAFRKVTPLRPAMILTDHLYAFTCGIFYRRAVVDRGLRFDSSLKSLADTDFVVRALSAGHRSDVMHEYLSAFTWTGENLSAQSISRKEEVALRQRLPASLRAVAPFLRQWRHLERFMVGGYRSGPISYEVYVGEDDTQRTQLTCERPSYKYPAVQPPGPVESPR